jgi:subtilisin-like proprotein convertase family protein
MRMIRSSRHLLLLRLLLAGAGVLLLARVGVAQTTQSYTNGTAFTVPAAGPATPYSTSITVPAPTGTVTNVTVTLKDVTHQDPRQIRVILRGPSGQTAAILNPIPAFVASPVPVSHQDLVFTNRAILSFFGGYPLPGPYLPSTNDSVNVSLPAPAPSAPYPAALDTYIGSAPGGVWQIFVTGAGSPNVASGTIGGWTLSLDVAEFAQPMVVGTTIGASTNYGGTINVANLKGPITHVSATLYGVSHTYPHDLDVLLMGPTGKKVMLMSGAGNGTDVNNITLTFDDNAPAMIPAGADMLAGTYKPSNYLDTAMPSPAPSKPYDTLADFIGQSPNGWWRLFVYDHANQDGGQIAGWTVNIQTTGMLGITLSEAGFAPLTLMEGSSIAATVLRIGGTGGTVGANVKGSALNATYAKPGVDYTVAPSSVSLVQGQTQQNVIITAIDDGLPEGIESGALDLINPTGGVWLMNLDQTFSINELQLSILQTFPHSGRIEGGNEVALYVNGGKPGATVTWDGAPLAVRRVEPASATLSWVYVIAPAHAAGPVTIAITNPGGPPASLVNGYTYLTTPDDPTLDTDGDGMPDAWELRFGLDPLSAGDASLDGDRDGVTNLDEFKRGTHPYGVSKRYLAEGATGGFFSTSIALVNVESTPATVIYEFQKSDGTTTNVIATVEPMRRVTIDPATILGGAEFSTVIESDRAIVVDRTMTWPAGNPYGSHLESGVPGPSYLWYLAEGATNKDIDLFYLLQNPNDAPVTVQIQYDLPSPQGPIVKTYSLAPHSRTTLHVNDEAPALAWNDVAAEITSSDGPIIVERSMYRSGNGRTWDAGHEGAGVTKASTHWFFAEGATGSFFDLFLLLMNPADADTTVQVSYLLESGEVVVKSYPLAAHSRQTIYVDAEDAKLASAAMSMIVESTQGIVAERAMWWPDQIWYEAHDAAGAIETGARWATAEGEDGGTANTQTYILIANTSVYAGSATVTLLFENGSQATKTFPLNATSRFNVNAGAEFPEAHNRRFSAIVQSVDTGSGVPQIVVERSVYADGAGQTWNLGGSSLATKLP